MSGNSILVVILVLYFSLTVIYNVKTRYLAWESNSYLPKTVIKA